MNDAQITETLRSRNVAIKDIMLLMNVTYARAAHIYYVLRNAK